MPSLLRNVAALIAAITILQLAGGLLGVRLPIAFIADGHSRTELGLVAASYSAGFMMGAMIATMLLARVGHIRVYAACAAIFAAATLMLHFTNDVWSWGLARMAAGVSVALMVAAIESWMSFSISTRVRGEVMSVYMVMTKAALALGPFFAFGYAPEAAEPWMIAGAIAALSMVPICGVKFAVTEKAPPQRCAIRMPRKAGNVSPMNRSRCAHALGEESWFMLPLNGTCPGPPPARMRPSRVSR